jgi:hypothetical protein
VEIFIAEVEVKQNMKYDINIKEKLVETTVR